jgi:hypothetical protein
MIESWEQRENLEVAAKVCQYGLLSLYFGINRLVGKVSHFEPSHNDTSIRK